MPARPDLKRYDLFGWDYEGLNPLKPGEAQWYELWARRTGGPVLGLACGTGRLLCHLARAGFETVGLDLSETMCSLACGNISALPQDVQARVQVVQADMSRFDLGRQFGLIFVADNSLRELQTRAEIRSCLRCIRWHLTPGGVALVTERRFDPALYAGGARVFDWSPPRDCPEAGGRVSRRVEVALSPDRQTIAGTMRYKIIRGDGRETVENCPFEAPAISVDQFVELFSAAGFAVEACAGYREEPDDGKDPTVCFVCNMV